VPTPPRAVYPNRSLSFTGETLLDAIPTWNDPVRPSAQPGGRAAAPGRLGLLQAFINTFYDLDRAHGGDLFVTPSALGAWLAERGLLAGRRQLGSGDLKRAVALREGLRALIAARDSSVPDSGSAAQVLDDAVAGASLELRFTSAGPQLSPSGQAPIDRALGALLAVLTCAMVDGSWRRRKVCPGRHCGWVFYDHSRNNSGRWCSMNVCGGREKARTHYRRQHGQ
jgi:predicted RNA-binding Zn ribbon-like protein